MGGGKSYRAQAVEHQGFDDLEIYIRKLGASGQKQPGWVAFVPERIGSLSGFIDRGRNENLIRFLEVHSPRGERTALEFLSNPPISMLEGLKELFGERTTDEEPRQFHERSVSQGHPQNGARGRAKGSEAGESLQAGQRGKISSAQEWLQNEGLLGA